MADETHQELIIVKRVEEEEPEFHSSAWKVAHADFMTAMMAFFLIMWLINATDSEARRAIANYFNPMHLSDDVGVRKGLRDPDETKDGGGSETEGDKRSSMKKVGGDEAGAGDSPQRGEREQALFQDPYAVLAEISTEDQDPKAPTSPDAAIGETGAPGTGSGDATRDPFDPVYWQMTMSRRMRTEQPGLAGNTNTPADGFPDAGSRRTDAGIQPSPEPQPGQTPVATGTQPEPPATPQSGPQPLPAAATTGSATLAMTSPAAAGAAAPVGSAARPVAGDGELQALRAEVAADVQAEDRAAPAPQVEVRATNEGVIVSLTDDDDFSMFAVGSAVPDPKLVRTMEKIGRTLAERPGEIVIRGFTDARQYRSASYDNWRLSTARAHIAQYMLMRGGLDDKRVREIEGFADRKLKNASDPNAPENRRIEILLRSPAS